MSVGFRATPSDGFRECRPTASARRREFAELPHRLLQRHGPCFPWAGRKWSRASLSTANRGCL